MPFSATLVLALGVLAPSAPEPDLDWGPSAVLKDTRPDPKETKANESFVRGQVARFNDPHVLRVILKDPDVAGLVVVQNQPQPEKWLREKLKVTAQPDKGTITISFPGFAAKEQRAIVNAAAEAYVAEEFRERRERCGRGLKALEYLQERESETLQSYLRTPVGMRDAKLQALIDSVEQSLAVRTGQIKEIRKEYESNTRLQIQTRAKGEP
jgi:hypothetical protein